MTVSDLPTIDLQASDEVVKQALETAFTTIGFALISGHGIAEGQVSEMRQLLKTYFNRPLSEKLQESITPENYRGYIPLGFFRQTATTPSPITMRVISSTMRSLKKTRSGHGVIYMAPIAGPMSPLTSKLPF